MESAAAQPKTARDALIHHLLGDVGKLHDLIKALPGEMQTVLSPSLGALVGASKEAQAQVVVDVNGVGYDVNISLNTYANVKELHEGKIYVHLSIKEDAHTLYGFADDDERKMFRHLITVNGVGTNTHV